MIDKVKLGVALRNGLDRYANLPHVMTFVEFPDDTVFPTSVIVDGWIEMPELVDLIAEEYEKQP